MLEQPDPSPRPLPPPSGARPSPQPQLQKPAAKPKRKRRPQLTGNERDRVMWAALERFARGLGAGEIVDDIKKHLHIDVSRESIYPLMAEARRRNLFVLTPPMDKVLTGKLRDKSGSANVHVADSFGNVAPASVSEYGAERALELIMQLGRERGGGAVHIAFGIGRMTHQIVRHLAARLDPVEAPRLVVHAMSPSYSLQHPRDTPLTAYDDLCRKLKHVEFADLAAQPYVDAADYGTLQDNRATGAGFDRVDEIDLVITSLACRHDQDGYLRKMLERFGPDGIERLDARGWIGDVHLCPFSADGPLEITEGLKPVTLFQFEELVQVSKQPGRHVMLLGSACQHCGRSKKAALLPLLVKENLRCWNTLIVDRDTALELLGVEVDRTGAWDERLLF